MPDPFEETFWREQLTPEQQAMTRRERAREMIEKANLGRPASAPPEPAGRHPAMDEVRERFELDFSRTNYVDGGAGIKISRTMADQFHVKHDPLPSYVEIGDPDGDADAGY